MHLVIIINGYDEQQALQQSYNKVPFLWVRKGTLYQTGNETSIMHSFPCNYFLFFNSASHFSKRLYSFLVIRMKLPC